jgi:predicted O-linked N-acetylglucosamine transferase (SPINDLY family)
LGNALLDLGCYDEAIESYRRALVLKPDYAEAHSNLANALVETGQPQNAVISSRRALALSPDFADAHNHLGNALKDLGRFDSAAECYRRAIEINPDFAVAHNNLGTVLQELGDLGKAQACYRRAMQIKPDYADAYSNLLYFYAYHGTVNSSSYLVQARLWEQIAISECEQQAVSERPFKRMSLEGRRLRVAYVSGDFCQHAVSYFIEQIFAHHDKSRIALFAYSMTRSKDVVTERLKALTEHWVSVEGWSVREIRERIEADDIDVLIDLSGHTAQNCLKVFAQRAAPVQAHYLGYFASTGLKEMDYWIGDAVLTPPETDNHFSERVWRLPRVWVSYEGKHDLPVSGWCPDDEGTIWLGSFNNLAKLTHETLSLWARVLHALPEGKLLLKTKALVDEVNCQRILKVMSGHGIDSGRIELQDGSNTVDWYSHMVYYDRLDIALDPVGGVGGGTTTCDALWMGVPVITLEGDRMASRMTSSMLKALGQVEWVACSEVEYVNKVVTLARDTDGRRRLRTAQRVRMSESALCDARGLVQCLEQAYFDMYQHWCDLRA